jgi:hypothetical protein
MSSLETVSTGRDEVFRMSTSTPNEPTRHTVQTRLDKADLEALEAERRRRAEAGKHADRSSLLREAVRAVYGGER